MSHLKERAEKNCLNCNAVIHGKYCHVCGQENLEPQESAWHLVTHFFNDITHFDGKFFSTLKYLVFKAGFLSLEYKAGRRASYLNPVRMYVFTSAVFFLIFFSTRNVDSKIFQSTYNGKSPEQIEKMDSITFNKFSREFTDGKVLTRAALKDYIDSIDRTNGLHFTSGRYRDKAQYDSTLRSGAKKHNWLEKKLIYREIEMNKKYNGDQRQIMKQFANNLIHTFPQMLFISLPVFAFILKLLYFRRKTYYYASHAIFSVHLYVFVFIMLLMGIFFELGNESLHWAIFNYLNGLLFIIIFFYAYKCMRNFYQQRRAKTILKFLLLNITMFVVVMILFIVFMLFSLLKT